MINYKNFGFDKNEVKDLILSSIALAFIFSFDFSFFRDPISILLKALVLFFIILFSFIPHELAHKFVAIKYGYYAKYEMWKHGLLFALVLAIISNGGFIFAAPGAVVIYSIDHFRKSRKTLTKENGIISMAGPMTNIIMSILALLLLKLFAFGAVATLILGYLSRVNAFLALFNMIPIPPFDGSKIIWWNIPIWIIMIVVSVLLYVFV